MDIDSALKEIEPIISKVRDGSESDLLELGERFEGIRPASVRVPKEIIEAALSNLDPSLRAVIEEAIRRVRIVHRELDRDAQFLLV